MEEWSDKRRGGVTKWSHRVEGWSDRWRGGVMTWSHRVEGRSDKTEGCSDKVVWVGAMKRWKVEQPGEGVKGQNGGVK